MEPGKGCIVPAAYEVSRIGGGMEQEQREAGNISVAEPLQDAGPSMLQGKLAEQLRPDLEVLPAHFGAHPFEHVQAVGLNGPPAQP